MPLIFVSTLIHRTGRVHSRLTRAVAKALQDEQLNYSITWECLQRRHRSCKHWRWNYLITNLQMLRYVKVIGRRLSTFIIQQEKKSPRCSQCGKVIVIFMLIRRNMALSRQLGRRPVKKDQWSSSSLLRYLQNLEL